LSVSFGVLEVQRLNVVHREQDAAPALACAPFSARLLSARLLS
jgi:hypothetical protein